MWNRCGLLKDNKDIHKTNDCFIDSFLWRYIWITVCWQIFLKKKRRMRIFEHRIFFPKSFGGKIHRIWTGFAYRINKIKSQSNLFSRLASFLVEELAIPLKNLVSHRDHPFLFDKRLKHQWKLTSSLQEKENKQ